MDPPAPQIHAPARTRRQLLARLMGSLLGLGMAALSAAAGLWAAATARFLVPNVLDEPPLRWKVGLPQEYPLGRVETRYKERLGLWLVHCQYAGQQQIVALRVVCTHLGCITLWQDSLQRFQCPCHGSSFSLQGINVEGPAPRPLERYAIRIADDGQLEIDQSQTFREDLGQWSDPRCFVRGGPPTPASYRSADTAPLPGCAAVCENVRHLRCS